MARHLVWLGPLGLLAGYAAARGRGAAAVAVGLGLALANFALNAAILSRAAQVSLPALQAGALMGFLLRLAVMAGALFLLREVDALHFPSLGAALCFGHLAFMTAEVRSLGRAMSLAGEA